MCAKNALRRSARPARHIDAHSAGCGMLLVTLQASIKTPGGACTAFAYHVMLSSIVLPAKENEQRNISALQLGQPGSRIEECACNALLVVVVVAVAVAVVVVASEISYKKLAIRFSRLAAGSLLAAALLPLRLLLLRLLVSAAAY